MVLCNGAEHVDDVEYWLSYMPMRNRAEVIRLMLAYADVPYAFEVVGYLRYEPEVKPTMNSERPRRSSTSTAKAPT